MSPVVWTLPVIGVGLMLVLLASAELGLRSLSRVQLLEWVERNQRGGEGLEAAPSHDLEVILIVLRLGRQLSVLGLAVAVYACLAAVWPGVSAWLVVLVALALFVLLDKLASHAIVASVGPERVLVWLRPLIELSRLLLGGLAGILYGTLRRTRTRQKQADEPPEGGLGTFLEIVEEEGWVTEREEALLRGVAHFGEAVVSEAMTPRVDVVCIEAGRSLTDLRRLVAREKYSRIPVVRGNVDNVVGVVHIKDLVIALEEGREREPVTSIARPALFVPETKRVRDLLREFQRRRAHLSIVVDEYGGTAGLVTLEDVLEEIVGEIQDESEPPEQPVVPDADGVFLATGKAEIEEVERVLGTEIEGEEFETVGGLVFTHLGRVPEVGESFEYGDLRIEVTEADERRIRQVRIRRR